MSLLLNYFKSINLDTPVKLHAPGIVDHFTYSPSMSQRMDIYRRTQ